MSVSVARVVLLISIEVHSGTKRSVLTMKREFSRECWNWFASILGSVIAGSRNCFSVKGIELVLTERIVFGVARA